MLAFQAFTFRKKINATPVPLHNICVFASLRNDENQRGRITRNIENHAQVLSLDLKAHQLAGLRKELDFRGHLNQPPSHVRLSCSSYEYSCPLYRIATSNIYYGYFYLTAVVSVTENKESKLEFSSAL